MSIEIDFTYKTDGFFDYVNYYRSETPMDLSNMPSPIQTGIQGLSFTDTSAVDGVDYYVRFSTVKNSVEKISDEIKLIKSDPYWDNVICLMHFDNNIIDVKGNTWNSNNTGYSYVDSLQNFNKKLTKEYNSNSYIQVNDSNLGDLDHNDFTIEFIFTTPTNSNSMFCWILATDYINQSGSRGWQIVYQPSTSKLSFASSIRAANNNSLDFAFIESTLANIGISYKIAITRKGDIFRMFVDGILKSQQEKHATMSSGNKIFSGMSPASNTITKNSFSIDELRITRGVARYTENYTPESIPFIHY